MKVPKRRFIVRTEIAVDRLARIALALCLALAGQSLAAGGDSRARFVSPVENQRFAPGDAVDVVVRTTVPLAAAYAGVGLHGVGVLQLTRDADGVTYRSRFVIPNDFAGSSTLTISAIDSKANPFNGEAVTIVVRPSTGPQSLSPVQADHHFNLVGTKARLYVTGNYAGGITRDISSSATGTVYASSDPGVIRVDAEGNVDAVGLGTASVSATNAGQKTLFTFIVEDPGHFLPPQDMTAQVRFERSPLEVDAALTKSQQTPIYAQTVTVTNTSDSPLVGPLYLTLIDLPKEGWPLGLAPGRPVYYLSLRPKDGLTLGPGERVATTL
ncbi:MAG TPA: hypothetical protein VK251_07030, partial [Steroidobacteraceae bacterium]|nr:hypothetical protein [Steroidobacteraceae bacterium]